MLTLHFSKRGILMVVAGFTSSEEVTEQVRKILVIMIEVPPPSSITSPRTLTARPRPQVQFQPLGQEA